MNKQELISAAAEKTGFSKKDTEATVNAALEDHRAGAGGKREGAAGGLRLL